MKRFSLIPALFLCFAFSASCQDLTNSDESGAAFVQAGNYGNEATFQVAVGDFDGDRDLDAGVYYANRYNRVYVNDRSGRLESLGSDIPGMAFWGDLDFVGASGGEWPDTPLTILRNDGTGEFEYDSESRVVTGFGRIALADLDGSGYLDVFVSLYELPDVIAVNDGFGGFVDSAIRLGSNGWEGTSAIGTWTEMEISTYSSRDMGGAGRIQFG